MLSSSLNMKAHITLRLYNCDMQMIDGRSLELRVVTLSVTSSGIVLQKQN